jgi:outer membrane protein assembly factor BamB
MKKLLTSQIALIVLLGVCVGVVSGGDNWPTWRGPDMNGIASGGNPPLKWSESENIKWKVKLEGDASNSSPVIWGDKIFFQTAVDTKIKDDTPTPAPAPMPRPGGRPGGGERGGFSGHPGGAPGGRGGRPGGGGRRGGRPGGGRGMGMSTPTTQFKFNLVCMDRKTGKILWQKAVSQVKPHEGHHGDHGFSSYSPVTDGKLVWANFGSRGICCFDVDGKPKWSRDLGTMSTVMSFGEGGSLAVAGDAVIVVRDQQGDSCDCRQGPARRFFHLRTQQRNRRYNLEESPRRRHILGHAGSR